jgi:hypothetical protein
MATKKVKKSAAKTASKTTKKVAEEAKAAAVALEAATVSVKDAVAAKLTDRQERIDAPELFRLRKMNLWLALAFGVQAVAVVLFGGSKAASITMEYLAPDQMASAVNGHQVLGLASRHIADLRLTVAAAGFLILFGLVCLLMATVGRARYEYRLQQGSNVARWVAFGIGGGGMVVALALESGISSLALLILLFVSMLMAGVFEPIAEKFKAKKAKTPMLGHTLCAVAVISAALPWVVFVLNIIGAALWGGKIPGTLWGMYASTFILFSCWALGAHFRVTRRGKWASTLYSEKMLMFLTLAIGTVLAWQIFAGAI